MEKQRIFWVVLSVSVLVVIVLIAGVYFLRQKPQAVSSPAGTISPITGPGPQVFEYPPEKTQSQTGPEPSMKPGEPQTMHFYIGEGAEKQQTPPLPAPPGQPPVPPAQPLAQVKPPAEAQPLAQTKPQAQAQPQAQAPVQAQPPVKSAKAPVAAQHPGLVAAVPRKVASSGKAAVRPRPSHREVDYWIQTGSYKSQSKAEELVSALSDKGLSGKVFSYDALGGTFYRVRLGPYTNEGEADKFLSIVKQIQGLEASFVSQVGGARNLN